MLRGFEHTTLAPHSFPRSGVWAWVKWPSVQGLFGLKSVQQGHPTLSSEVQCPLLSPLRLLEDLRFAVVRLKPTFLSGLGLRPLLAPTITAPCSFPCSSVGKESAHSTGDLGSIPGLGRSPGEMEMATHSSILAWKISWTEEPGGLQSMGSQRVGHD